MNGPGSEMRVAVLLFSDLVGSVSLQDQLGTQFYSKLLARHHELFRQAIEIDCKGKILNYTGDGFLAELPSPSAAVDAALRFQYLLKNEAWGPAPLHARMAVHLGEITEMRDDKGAVRHVGRAVNYTARLMDLAQGGQILLSKVIWDDARMNLRAHPEVVLGQPGLDLEWKSHGYYLLKGATDPVEVFEVGAHGIAPLTQPPDSPKAVRVVREAVSQSGPAKDERAIWERLLHPTKHERRGALIAGLASGLLGALVLMLKTLDDFSYDAAYLFKLGETPPEIVIVEMDERSNRELSMLNALRWDRRLHAQILQTLAGYGARAVGFDISFDTESSDPNEDQALFDALAKTKIGVLGARFEAHSDGRSIIPPHPKFRPAARYALVEEQSQEQKRVLQPIREFNGVRPMTEVLAQMGGFGELKAPNAVWLKYYGKPGTIEHRSYVEVLSNTIPANVFTNKVVLIGANAKVSFANQPGMDYFESPFSWSKEHRQIPGVEIIATSFANLVRKEYLRRLPPIVEFVIMIGFGLAAGWVLRLAPLKKAITLAGATALAVAIVLPMQVWTTSIWFPWAVLAFVTIPVAVSTALLSRRIG